MDPKYEALFTPWKVGNVEIKNRIVMCELFQRERTGKKATNRRILRDISAGRVFTRSAVLNSFFRR